MTEQEWLECADPVRMLEFLRGKASDRKLRLVATACCRQIWHLLRDDKSRKAVEIAERFADGTAAKAELDAARCEMEFFPATLEAAAFLASVRRYDRPSIVFRYGIVDITRLDSEAETQLESICNSGFQFPVDVAIAIAQRTAAVDCSAGPLAQATIVRCIFGPLSLRPIIIDPTWLTATVGSLATAVYEERAFDRLPILADALEDAGCTNADILNHCRLPGEHVRGCWCVDLLLGKP